MVVHCRLSTAVVSVLQSLHRTQLNPQDMHIKVITNKIIQLVFIVHKHKVKIFQYKSNPKFSLLDVVRSRAQREVKWSPLHTGGLEFWLFPPGGRSVASITIYTLAIPLVVLSEGGSVDCGPDMGISDRRAS